MTFAEDLERVEAIVVDTPRGKRALVIARDAQKWLDARKPVKKVKTSADTGETLNSRKPEPRQCPLVGRAMESDEEE